MGQKWSVNSLGGYATKLNLSEILRTAVQPGLRFRQMCNAKNALGKHKGSVFHWNVFSDVTNAGGTVAEDQTAPETNFTITQGTLTLKERMNSVPYTGVLEDFAEQPIEEIVRVVLKNDCKKTLDTAAFDQFKLTPLRVAPTGGTNTSSIVLTTNGTATQTNNVDMGSAHVRRIVNEMKERNIPAFGETDDYYCLGRPSTFVGLSEDLESIQQYTETGYGKIMKGEKGRFAGCRFIEQSNIAAGTGSTAAAAWTNSKSDYAYFMGDDTVAEAVCIPEEVRAKLPGDYGRDEGIAWYSVLGFGLVHSAAAQARIVMWDSAK